jgi:signal transduction histidine kinase
MIPITIIVWQYDFRRLVFYCLVLAGIELGYNLILGAPDTLHGWNLLQYSVARIVIFLAIGYLISRMVEAQRQQRTALAHANQQLRQYATTLEQLTISRERNRMAHELHDTMAHTMSGMILQLEGAQLMWDSDNIRARQSLDEAIGTARQGLHETRRALKALRARPVEEKGIVEAIRQLAVASAKRSNFTLDLHVPAQPLLLAPVLEQTVYRIAQEALTNIERHAWATAVSLELSAEHGQLRLTVRDNGCGFALEAAEKSDRLGLRGMRERAELVDGQLKVASLPGQGTTLEFRAKAG